MTCGRVSPLSTQSTFEDLAVDFEGTTGTAEIVRLAERDTIKSNVFARTAIRYIQSLPEGRLLKKAVVMFDQAM